jgi:hypothetical protein
MTSWLPAVLTGAVLGYGIIYLRETGWLIAAIVTAVLVFVYWRQGRRRDIGLLMTAEGIWPALVASWGLYQAATRTDTEVGPEMWLFLGIGLLLIMLGAAVVVSSTRRGDAP